MYTPSELLEQIKKQVLSEFSDQITTFEWWNEDEYTTIMVRIRSLALEIPVSDRIRQIVNAIIGHPDSSDYIVAISVAAIESVDATDGLFNLTYKGAVNSFFVDYYAPESPASNPFAVPIHDMRMFKAVHTIHLDSAAELWQQLCRPIDEAYAKQMGILSFKQEALASDLRDFLIEQLDFIKHIAEAISCPAGARNPLQIIEPAPMPSISQATNGTGASLSYVHQAREVALSVAAAD